MAEALSRIMRKRWKWYRGAAKSGYVLAQYNLGSMYQNGIGVAPDYEEAAKWYRLAAEAGYVLAQNTLGMMYQMVEAFHRIMKKRQNGIALRLRKGMPRPKQSGGDI